MTKSLNKVTLQKKEELQWQKEDINDLNFQLSIKLLAYFLTLQGLSSDNASLSSEIWNH